jgi:hypothetical protein
LELFQSLRPVAYGGAVGHEPKQPGEEGLPGPGAGFGKGMPMPKAAAPMLGAQANRKMDQAARRGFAEQMEKSLKDRMDLSRGIQSAATASQLGDFFQYVINQPVNLPRQKSALLPIVNKDIEAKRLSIYNPNVHAKFPMLGLKLTNTSGLHLMQGPITVFEGSTYAGDARITDLPPNDDRLISYAVDLGTEVEAKSKRAPDHLTNVRIQYGLIFRTDRIREEKTYTATNRTGQPRTLWIEHPYRADFELVSKEKPVERTSEVYRFEMKLPAKAKESVSQTIVEEKDLQTSISINNSDDNTIRFFINSGVSSAEVKSALQKALEYKTKRASTRQELQNVNEQLRVISEDQARLRANLKEMPTTAAAYKRYVEKFDKQETEVESLREQQKKLQSQELKSRQDLDRYLNGLNVK